MQAFFGSYSVKFSAKKAKSVIDNITFRLHYKITFVILAVAAALSTSYQYFGNAIDCMQKGIPGGMMNTYCWVHGTFTVPAKLAGNIGENMPHPGVGPTTDPNLIKTLENGDEIRHAWYQWVPFVLCAQALLFYFPHYLWKSWEGGKIGMLVENLDSLGLQDPDSKRERREASVNYFVRALHSHNLYVAKYIICEILNLVNVLCQIYFMDYFLGGQFLTYGMDVLNISEESFNERVDPMSKVFPKLTKCTFNKYGPSGTVEMTDGLCLLAINIINEKIYIFLWFWFATVAIFTGIHMILRFTSIASIQFRRIYLFKRAKANNRNDVSSVVNKLWYGDWFLLMQLSKHYDPVVFQEFMVDLRDRLKLRGQDNQE